MNEPDLKDLLTIMRRMHLAATSCQWETVETLDEQRQLFLDRVSVNPEVTTRFDRAALREIIELDHAVMLLASQGLELIAHLTHPVAECPGI